MATKELITSLYNKLKNQIFDAGSYFQIMENENVEMFEVYANKDLKAY